jgi:Uma2 family endonuclease
MSDQPHHSTMSVEEYFQLERDSPDVRYEYIDGQVRMLAGGTLDHSMISSNIISHLRGALRGSPCRVLTSDAKVRLSATRYVLPDVTVSCDSRDRGKVDCVSFPRLIVEVLSPSTEDYDRGRKFLYYRECPTIQEYLLVSAEYPLVEVCRREKNDLWSIQTIRPDNIVELTSIGVRFPLEAIYEDIVFTGDEHQ